MKNKKTIILAIGAVVLSFFCRNGSSAKANSKARAVATTSEEKRPEVFYCGLGHCRLFYDADPNSVYVQVGNFSNVKIRPFVVRFSVKDPATGTKEYFDKSVAELEPNSDVVVIFNINRAVANLEFGAFVDAKKQIKESNETNCGKLLPGGASAGLLPCDDF